MNPFENRVMMFQAEGKFFLLGILKTLKNDSGVWAEIFDSSR
jgi:hypothetical protein